ncbi:hypothetical protein chiPu_0008237 [Chiloscyllium punctatum]|uniref:Uncharacterized protein n=1 Tax=Chiloscyllium punctatum TaxID=137246 RepID=A0A401SHH5_CHIPU|nr:hypothetical protein [Chiloscyllium punctatum]
MPISSGAEGHIGVGVDTSIKWSPGSAEALDHFPRRRNTSYLQRYLDTHLFTRKKYGNELEKIAEEHSTGSIGLLPAAVKVKGNRNSSEEKINEGENSNCLEGQNKAGSVSHLPAINKSKSLNRLEHSSLCTVL